MIHSSTVTVTVNFLTCPKIKVKINSYNTALEIVPVTCPEIPGLLQEGTTGF